MIVPILSSSLLMCRGGAGISFSFSSVPPERGDSKIWMSFGKGDRTETQGVRGLQPGTCTWEARDLGPDEPPRIALSDFTGNEMFLITWSGATVRGVRSSLPFLRRLEDEKNWVKFDVYKDAEGNLIGKYRK
jgi:hypothetical protein